MLWEPLDWWRDQSRRDQPKTVKSVTVQVDSFQCEQGVVQPRKLPEQGRQEVPPDVLGQGLCGDRDQRTGPSARRSVNVGQDPVSADHQRHLPRNGRRQGVRTELRRRRFSGHCQVQALLVQRAARQRPGDRRIRNNARRRCEHRAGRVLRQIRCRTGEYDGAPGSGAPSMGTEPDPGALFRNGLGVANSRLSRRSAGDGNHRQG